MDSSWCQLITTNEARTLLEDSYSCLVLHKDQQVITLNPRYMDEIDKGLLETLKMQIGIYSERFVILLQE
jgi:hypothetical protein